MEARGIAYGGSSRGLSSLPIHSMATQKPTLPPASKKVSRSLSPPPPHGLDFPATRVSIFNFKFHNLIAGFDCLPVGGERASEQSCVSSAASKAADKGGAAQASY